MGLWSKNKTTATNTQSTGASEDSQLLQDASVGARDQGIALADATLNTGLQFEGVGGNVTLTDGGVVASALDVLQKQSADYSSALKDILQKTNDNQSSQQTYALGKITELSESKQTDGVAIWKKPVVIIGVVLLLVIGWIAYQKK